VSEKEDRIEHRLNWVSIISTPDQLRREIISILKAPPTLCNNVEVNVSEPLGGEVIGMQGVIIKQYALVIAEITCDNEKYEAHFKSHVFEVSGGRILFDLDLNYVTKMTVSGGE
jgi:hypothetical protein